MPRTSRDGAASADFKKESVSSFALQHGCVLQLSEDPQTHKAFLGGTEQVLWLNFPSVISGEPIPSLLA